jgi:hypothetical protein
MSATQEAMYWAGSLILLIGLVFALLKGFSARQEQENEGWHKEWEEQIQSIGKQAQGLPG